MKKKKFPVSRVGLGTVQFGVDYGYSKALAQADVNKILSEAYKKGVNFLDTAREYGDSEKKIGEYCGKNPGRFTVATKLAYMDKNKMKDAAAVTAMLEDSIEESKKSLGQGSLPLFFLHQAELAENGFFWEALSLARKKISARFGLSVYDPEPTRRAVKQWGALIDCVQAPYNVADQRFASLADLFRENGIVFMSRSTFLKGALVEDKLPSELKGLEPVRNKLKELSKRSGLSVSQLLTMFALDADFIDCTLIGVRSVEQLRENLDLSKSKAAFLKVKEELSKLEVSDPFLIDPRKWKTL